jgi:hypothetical protein
MCEPTKEAIERISALDPSLAVDCRGTGIEGREIAAPPWSFACMNDQGPQQCDEPVWVYGSPDYLAQFKNAF